jgi:DNA polymerase-3 subunit gamma/tau
VYQALYRKWRPAVFGDVVGQPHITQTLKNELIAGRVAHAYIFTGSRGTGKTSCAKIFAKAVNCLGPIDADPCNKCENCRGIDSGSILDVIEIDAASNRGVDSIRELREEAGFTPASAKYRVYIIDEAHMLTPEAFNALLKILEEPPAHLIFIFATTEAHKIPATVMSRFQRFDFRRISPEDIQKRLLFVSQSERMTLTPQAAELIARLADGSLRDALSILDLCAGAGGEIDEETVRRSAGIPGDEYLYELSRAVREGDPALAISVLGSLYSASKDIERLCEELISHFRDILLIKVTKNPEVVPRPSSDIEKLKAEAEGFSEEAVLHALDTLQGALETLRRSTSRRVEMEMALVRLCRPELDSAASALLHRLSALEGKMSAAPHARRKEAPASQESRPKAEKAAEPEDAKQRPADSPLSCWPEIIEALGSDDPPLCGFLKGSTAILRGSHVLVDSSNEVFAGLIQQQSHQKALVEAIRKVTGKPYKVGILKKPSAPKADPIDEIEKVAKNAGITVKET